MTGKENSWYLEQYVRGAERVNFSGQSGSIVDLVLGEQLDIDKATASEIFKYCDSVLILENASVYETGILDRFNSDNYLTTKITLEDSEFKNERIKPLSISANLKRVLGVEKDIYVSNPLDLVSPFLTNHNYELRRSYSGDSLKQSVHTTIPVDVSPDVEALSIIRFVNKDLKDVCFGTLYLRDSHKVRKLFGKNSSFSPKKIVTAFNGVNVIKGVDNHPVEVTTSQLKELGVGLSFKENADGAVMSVGLHGAIAHMVLGKQLAEDYGSKLIKDGLWLTYDNVVVEPQPIYQLN